MSLMRNPNIFYGYGRKRRVGRPRRGRGAGFFSSIGNALSGAHDFIKRNKIISTVGNALSGVGIPYAGAIGNVAETLGYGRRRRRVVRRRPAGMGVRRRRVVHRRRVGRGFLSGIGNALSKANDFAKKTQIISKAATALGHPNAAGFASSLGYGRRRRRVVHRRRGGGFLSGIGNALSKANDFAKKTQIISKAATALGHPNAAGFASSLGYGRRRRPVRRTVRHRGGANFFSTNQIAAPKF